MRFVEVVAEAGVLAIAARLAVVLSRWLPIHLIDATAGPAYVAQQQVDVVDLTRRRRRLVTLVHALQARRQQCPRPAQYLRHSYHRISRHTRHCLDIIGRVAVHHAAQVIIAERVCVHKRAVDVAALDEQVLYAVQQRDVCTYFGGNVDGGGLGGGGEARVDDDHLGWVGPVYAVEHARP